jgi:hypothetical protein
MPAVADASVAQPTVEPGPFSVDSGFAAPAPETVAEYRAPEIIPPISSDYGSSGPTTVASAPNPTAAPAPHARPEGSRTFNQIPFFAALNNKNQPRAAAPAGPEAAKPAGPEPKPQEVAKGPAPDTSLTPKGPKGRGKTQAELDEEQRKLLAEYQAQFGNNENV